MSELPTSRRTLLRTGTTLTGVGLFTALAGCQGMLSESTDETPSGDGSPTDGTALAYVPESATLVVTADLDGLRTDDTFRSTASELLTAMPNTPDSVSAALDLVQRTSGLDARAASQLVVFGTVDRYGAVVRADWSTDDLVDAVVDESPNQRTLGDRTLYFPEADRSGTVVASLGGGWHALGGFEIVRDAIDVQRGETDPVGGTVRAQYEATRDGHIRFGASVPAVAQLFGSGEDAALANVTAARGSVTGGESSQLRVRAETADEAKSVATAVRTWLDGIESDIAMNPQVDANEKVGAAIEATTVETDGSAVVVENDRGIDTLVYVGGAILFSFVLGLENQSTLEVPNASLSFGYDRDARIGTISHDGGDAIAASNLYVRGDDFVAAEGADLTESAPWPAADGQVEAGDQVTVGLEPAGSVKIVYERGVTTANLASFSAPDI